MVPIDISSSRGTHRIASHDYGVEQETGIDVDPRGSAVVAYWKRTGGGVLLALGVLVIVAALVGGHMNVDRHPVAHQPSTDRPDRSATHVVTNFTMLASARTNRCDLTAHELLKMPNGKRLQGSCCSPMDRHRYDEQVASMRAYRRDRRLVPTNPYDVSVSMAKRLLHYRAIDLDRRQQGVYNRATKQSTLGGPCCCQCWRWEAFDGQARFLIARRHDTAAEIARLWEQEEGCGGGGDHA